MDIEGMFQSYHGEVTSLAKDVVAVKGEVGKLIDKMTALAVAGPGAGVNQRARSESLQAFAAFARKGDVAPTREIMAATSMTVGSDPDGGYTVLPEVDQSIREQLVPISPMRKLARVVTMSAAEYHTLVQTGVPDSGWVGESDSRPAGNGAKFSDITNSAKEVFANVPVSQSLIDDSFTDIGAFLTGAVARAFAAKEGLAWISGDGVLQPRGIMTYPTSSADDSTRAFGTLQYTPSTNATGFDSTTQADCLHDLMFSLSSVYRAGASFVMNSKTASVISKFKTTTGEYIWQDGLAAGVPPTLMGYPVSIDENLANIGANAFPVMFANLSEGYLIADRIGTRVLRDPFTAKPNVLFYCTKRTSGSVIRSDAIKLLKISVS